MKNFHYIEHNHITLLHNGQAYFPKLEAAIETAQFEIYIETYIFEYDAIGIRVDSPAPYAQFLDLIQALITVTIE